MRPFFTTLMLLFAMTASADTTISLNGGARLGPQDPNTAGQWVFPNVPLRKNAVNRFTVTAEDNAGNEVSRDLEITQISLDEIVVAEVKAERLSVEEIEQLVEDGIIDLDDPENFNVSSFAIALTIAKESFVFDIPVAIPKVPEEEFEEILLKKRVLGGGRAGRVSDTQIIVFETRPPGDLEIRPRIPGVIIIQGDIKTLKEFFSVRLLLMNTSGIFTLENVTAMIDFPEGGLSNTFPADGIALFNTILPGTPTSPAQKEREFIIRGDEIGVQPVRVDFGGELTGPGIDPNDPIPFSGSALTEVEVKGPPQFTVKVVHPDTVTAFEPYELSVEITNTDEIPALYASLELDVGADAELTECTINEATMEPDCVLIEGSQTRDLGHILPGQKVLEIFTVTPFSTGPLSSCMGVSDQNIALEVFVGNLGCVVGKFPPDLGEPEGIPTVSVLPTPNSFGINPDSPVVAFFSEKMDDDTIKSESTFTVFDDLGQAVPGFIQTDIILERTAAVWQRFDNFGKLDGNTEYTIFVSNGIRDLDGNQLFNEWTSTFTTTDPTNDTTPPFLTMAIQPPVDPTNVLPGQIIEIDAFPTDQGSRLDRVELRIQDQDANNPTFELIDQKTVFDSTTLPCVFAIDSGRLVPGHTYQFKGSAFDKAGNRQDATVAAVIATSNAPPTLILPDDPNDPVLQGISVTVIPEFVSGAVQRITYFLDAELEPFKTVFISPFQASLRTSELPLGPHTIRAVAEDGLGQTTEDTFSFELVENPNEPMVEFVGVADGAEYIVGSQFSVNGNADDPVGIASVSFFLDTLGGTPLFEGSEAFLVDTAALAAGAHQVIIQATNNVGVTNSAANPDAVLDFIVLDQPTGNPPAAPLVSTVSVPDSNGETTITGTSVPGARIDVTNLTDATESTVFADATGAFTTTVNAISGDVLRLIAFSLSESASPSAPTDVVAPVAAVLTGLQITPTSLTFNALADFADVTVTAFFSDASSTDVTNQVAYDSDNIAAASVSGTGRVLAIADGTANISATLNGVMDQIPVNVDVVTLDSFTVAPTTISFTFLQQTVQIGVTGFFSDGSSSPLTEGNAYSIGNPSVATVNTSGLVTAIGEGSTSVFVSRSGEIPIEIPVSVDIASDPPPTVEILSPGDGAEFERGEQITLSVRGTDAPGGVSIFDVDVTGSATFSEVRVLGTPSVNTIQLFNFNVDANAPISSTIDIDAFTEDTSGGVSPVDSISLTVVDDTPPTVQLLSPVPDTQFNFGDTVTLRVTAQDDVALAEVGFNTSGALVTSDSIVVSGNDANATLTFDVPFGLTDPDVRITAFARDASGNETDAAPVDILITDADITPPMTEVISVGNPGSSATTTVGYQITDGVADIDHVRLFFRRDGIGTFNRFTDPAGGNPLGEFVPQSGSNGTIEFDSTRMGGDGDFEFFTLGVDAAGNLEDVMTDPNIGKPVADILPATTFSTGTAVATFNLDTEILAPIFDDQNIRIDGATVTIVGAHAFRNVEIVNGGKLTHRKTDLVDEFELDLDVWTLTVDMTSSVDVSGLGYLGGKATSESGQTLGNVPGSTSQTGGSYGGLGGDGVSGSGGTPNPVYGDLTNPMELGSGGGASGGTDGGDGGGLLLLNAINVAVDGSIRSNGALGAGSRAGEGSGGGINIATRTLSGMGTVQADGGSRNGVDGTGGGGGRIAISYLDLTTANLGNITAQGGNGFFDDGADGTVFLKQDDQVDGDLVISGVGPGSPFTDLVLPAGQVFDNLTLINGARVIARSKIVISGTLLLTGDSVLTHPSEDPNGLLITADSVIVELGSEIDVTGRGHRGGKATSESGRTLGDILGSTSQSGGSYGGLGGDGVSGGGGIPNQVYGNPKRPNRLGSGGGASGGTDGGDGGGYLRLIVSNEVHVDGALRADGGLGNGSRAGEGSGGSIWITTSKLSGVGTISANGGSRNGVDGTGGGGGRIAIEYDFIDPLDDLNGQRNITAFSGIGFFARATAGTIFLHQTGQSDGDLIIDDAESSKTTTHGTPLLPMGPGVAQAVTANSLTVDGTLPGFLPNAFVGHHLNPNIVQAEVFEIASNDANSITVVTPNGNGVDFASVAGVGASYAGSWIFDNLEFRRGGYLILADLLRVNDTIDLKEFGLLTHPESNLVYEATLDVTTDRLLIDPNSRIEVTARGYLGGKATSESGRTLGNVLGATDQAGGSYGGLGGDGKFGGGSIPNPIYGDLTDPIDLGSGGGASGGTDGGDGGGRIFIDANEIVNDGAILSNGGLGNGSRAGEGSGGSIGIQTTSLDGTGVIRADGGSRNGVDGTAGGGGRIALRYNTATLPLTNVSVLGGNGFFDDGGNGTVFTKTPGQTFGDLIIDGFGTSEPDDASIIPSGFSFDNIILRNGAHTVSEAGISVSGALEIRGNSTLTHAKQSEAGLLINADSIFVEAGSAIDVTGRGYRGGKSGSERGTTLGGVTGTHDQVGGSYGGIGGDGDSNSGFPDPVYGDPKRPSLLGSGGGASGGTDGGDGGGFVRLIVTNELRVDGAIRSNGGLGNGSRAGEGSGGSIWITTGMLAGTGEIRANGGSRGGFDGTAGGGGRVAIYMDSLDATDDLSGLRNVSAFGGNGFFGPDGAAGTIVTNTNEQLAGDLIIDGGTPGATWPVATDLMLIGPGITAAVTGDVLTVDGALGPFLANGFVGNFVNPDTSQDEVFEITSNDANSITVITPNSNGVDFSSVASVSAEYVGYFIFDNLEFRRGGHLNTSDQLDVTGTIDLKEFGRLTHEKTSDSYAGKLDVMTGTLVIDPNSAIDVTGLGFLGGKDTSESGTTVGFTTGSTSQTGGSHGGLGGDGTSAGTGVPNPVYGDVLNPVDLGSGGGAIGGTDGGDGGGRILIIADDVINNGAIRANGGLGNGSRAGEGSGGTVNLAVETYSGIGAVSADGGNRSGADGTGGGGGRIAINASVSASVGGAVTSTGGDGFFGDGEDGSISIQAP